jgi:NapC/NirT cytochrome c family, N-terminal region
MAEKKKFPWLAYNWVSLAGAVIALVAGFIIAFLLVINAITPIRNVYVGIILYMVLPIALIGGLLIIPAGMYAQWRREQKQGKITYLKWPSIDLNNRRQRNAAMTFILGTAAFILISAVGIYQAYHYTDSVRFCGLTCHSVMAPEYTTYQDSPHARVACVACHIGPGVGWYAKSKLAGLYQVYAVLADVYPRPIPQPISNLRPARETCEQCHWPRQFFGAQQRRFNHYLYDKANTYWPINMLIKIGGGNPNVSGTRGIHWHMNPWIQIEYIARDKKRQDIPWIRVTNRKTGEITVFQDVSAPLSKKDLSVARPRIMDCIDCHNHPSHAFHSPDYVIDRAIFSGDINRSVPDIKKVAVNALDRKYKSTWDAYSGIARAVTDFYLRNYPDLYSREQREIDGAIEAIQREFSKSIFPSMNVRWSEYPDNIGHFISRGCMRCHDGKHKSSDGLTVIPNDCRTCHVILSQGTQEPGRSEKLDLRTGLDFEHPVDIGGEWKTGACYECHSGIEP